MRNWARAAALGCLVAAALAGTCRAQGAPGSDAYPNRPVKIIVPFGAGGPGDLFARLIAQKLSENHPGAAGNIGAAPAARAAPDGYMLVVLSPTFMINASLYPKIPYDPVKD